VGNTATWDYVYTIDDITAPVPPAAPADITIDCGVLPAAVDLTAVDNCLGDITVSPTEVTIPGPNTSYDIIRTWTFVDDCGNISEISQTLSVNDTVPPIALCQDITVTLDNSTATVTITPQDIDNGSTDNCLIESMTVSPNTFGCDQVGENTVTLTVTDANGNVSTCTATVTIPPVPVGFIRN
jgi:hypothetical protein